jgi:enamine deaminase RidA (YjgF/YER057c/UK114 family)
MEKLGGSMEDIVRTRIYVTDMGQDAETVGLAHGEVFRDIRPACAMVEVKGLAHPDMLVEIEAEAVVGATE